MFNQLRQYFFRQSTPQRSGSDVEQGRRLGESGEQTDRSSPNRSEMPRQSSGGFSVFHRMGDLSNSHLSNDDDLGNALPPRSSSRSATSHSPLPAIVETTLIQATHHIDCHQWSEAIALCRELLDRYPTVAEAHKLLGTSLQAMDKIDQAMEHYHQALEIQPHYPEVYVNLGNLHARHDQWDAAVHHYQRAIALKPDFAGAYRNLAKVWSKQGNTRLATECAYRALTLDPDTSTPKQCLALGNALLRQGQGAQAVVCYRRVIEQDETFAGGYLCLAEALVQQGQWQEAVSCYQRAIQLQTIGEAEPHNGHVGERSGARLNGNGARSDASAGLNESRMARSREGRIEQTTHSTQRQLQTYLQNQQWAEVIALGQQHLQTLETEAASLYTVLSQALRADGQDNAALQCYRKLALVQPDNADAFANLGSLYASQQQWSQAIATYQRAIALKPDFAGAYRNLARVWTQTGDAVAAAECWYRALTLEPGFATAEKHVALGDTLSTQGKLDWARDCYRQALALNPTLAIAHDHLGQVLSQQDQWNEAIAHYQQAIQHDPSFGDAYDHLGLALVQLGQNKEAIACYRRLVALEPDVERSYTRLRDVLVEAGETAEALACYQWLAEHQPDHWNAQYQLGKALSQLRQWDAAIAPFQRAVRLNPQSVQAHHGLGHALRQQKRLTEAVQVFQRAIALDASQPWSHVYLGDVRTQLQDWDGAIAVYREAVTLEPVDQQIRQRLAIALRHRAKADEAEASRFLQTWIQENPDDPQTYYRALMIDPDNADLHVQLAQFLERQGKVDEAVVSYQEALWLRSDASEVAHQLGDALSKLERWSEAIAAYNRAIELNPQFSWSHHNRGDALLKRGRWSEAAEAFGKALALNPTFHWSAQNRADALFKLERWSEAIAAYDQALALNPDWSWSHYNRGHALAKLGRWERAIAAYQAALDLDPNMAAAHRDRADALARLERWPEAIHHYEKTVELAPDSPVAVYKNLGEALLRLNSPGQVTYGAATPTSTVPRICIVTPVYNGEQFIDDTIYSIVTQAGDFILRYHIQDGQSTDGTLDKIKAWEARLHRPDFVALCRGIEFSYASAPDQGMYDALNQGFEAIRLEASDVMTWLNADDRLATGALATVTSIFGAFESVQWIAGRTALMNQQGVTTKVYEPVLYSRRALKAGLHDGRRLPFVMQEGTFWRTQLWHQAGGLNPTFRLAGDYDLWRRFADHADLVFVDSVLASHRRHAGQLSHALEPYHQEIDQSLADSDPDDYATTWDVFKTCSTRDLVDQGFTSSLLQYDGDRHTWQLTQVAPTFTLHPALVLSSSSSSCEIDIVFSDSFGPAEGPYPTKNLPAGIRWTHHRANPLTLKAPQAGHYTLTLTCQTFSTLSVRLRLGETVLFTGPLPVTHHARHCKVVASALLTAGPNEVVLEVEPETDGAFSRLLVIACEAVMTEPPQTASPHRSAVQRQGWPYQPMGDRHWPETLPDGRPWPKISIVTPSYNQGRFIEETILSVIHQQYPNLEYIVIDGDSTDETLAVINRYRDRIHVVLSEPDRGQSDAINKGFRQATGDILGWLNSDDRLAPGALYAAALAFHTSGADLIAGLCQVFEHNQPVMQHLTSCASGEMSLDDLLDVETRWLAGQFFYQPEVLFTSDLWQRAGGYVEESLYYSMDYELWARFAATGARLQVVGYPIAQYRMHPDQKTSTTERYKPELLATRDTLRQRFQRAVIPVIHPEPQKSRLRIVLFNDVGFYGGAGIAHERIASALALAGHEVIPVAGRSTWLPQPQPCSPSDIEHLIASLKPDLVVVGNLHNLEHSVEILDRLSARFPTLFVMHDQWLLTGRCAYTGNCQRYQEGCDVECPTSHEYPALPPDEISGEFDRKRSLLQREKFTVLGNSNWMTRWAQTVFLQSGGAQEQSEAAQTFQPIRYGLDTALFYPMDKAACRRKLDLPLDRFIILTGSQSIDDERKGVKYLFKALDMAQLEGALLISFGHGTASHSTVEIRSAGYVQDPALLALYYSAADIFVGPSLEEAFGQTFIEAAACGTPAVGFAVGGVTQAICDGVSGRLVQDVTPEALAETLADLYGDRAQLQRLSTTAPIHVANLFSWEASYHSFMGAIAQAKGLDALSLQPNSKFGVSPPQLPQPIYLYPSGQATFLPQDIFSGISGRVVKGFGSIESYQLAGATARPVRWALWHKSQFILAVPESKIGQLCISCRSFIEGQRVELWHEETQQLLLSSLISPSEQSHVLVATIHLKKGANLLSLIMSKHQMDTDQRPLGLLIENIGFSNRPCDQNRHGQTVTSSSIHRRQILMDDDLEGMGWFPTETYQGQPVRWMEQSGTVIIRNLQVDSLTERPFKLEILGIMAIQSEFLRDLIVRLNGHCLKGQVEQHSEKSWAYHAVVDSNSLRLGEACVLTVESPGAKQLSSLDVREASILVKCVSLEWLLA